MPRGPGRARLNWILIYPTEHGRGIGSAMMRRALELANQQALGVISIAASHLSAPFFAKFGAIVIVETPNGWGPGMHRIDMTLSTPPNHSRSNLQVTR